MISGRRCVWHVPSEQRCLCCWETWRWGRLGMERERKAGSNNPLEKWSPVGDPELPRLAGAFPDQLPIPPKRKTA